MPKSQKQNLAVGGIQLNVFSPFPDAGEATGQAAVLFLLHGRLSKADVLEATAARLVERCEDRRSISGGTSLELVVITFVSSSTTTTWINARTDSTVRPGFEEPRH